MSPSPPRRRSARFRPSLSGTPLTSAPSSGISTPSPQTATPSPQTATPSPTAQNLAPCGHDLALTDLLSEHDIKCSTCFDNREIFILRLMEPFERVFAYKTPPPEDSVVGGGVSKAGSVARARAAKKAKAEKRKVGVRKVEEKETPGETVEEKEVPNEIEVSDVEMVEEVDTGEEMEIVAEKKVPEVEMISEAGMKGVVIQAPESAPTAIQPVNKAPLKKALAKKAPIKDAKQTSLFSFFEKPAAAKPGAAPASDKMAVDSPAQPTKIEPKKKSTPVVATRPKRPAPLPTEAVFSRRAALRDRTSTSIKVSYCEDSDSDSS